MSSHELDISPARDDEVPALATIASVCGLSVDFVKELSRSYAVLLVARRLRQPCGFLLAWHAADELHLTDLGVAPAARRRGVGRALVDRLRQEGQQRRVRLIVLEVRESNAAALALYAGLGFVEQARRPRYYDDTGEAAVVMQLDLR